MRRNPGVLVLALAAASLQGCGYMHHYHAHHYYPDSAHAYWWYGETIHRPLSPPVEVKTWNIPVLGDCSEPRCQDPQRLQR